MSEGQTASGRADAFLKIENLGKWYGEDRAVDDLSLVANKGEFLTLLGPSGCGKTTTLRCIAGFERPDEGRIILDTVCVSDAARHIDLPAERRQFGMVFQSYAVWPHMSVAENVAYGLQNRGLSKAETEERVSEVIDRVGLSGMASKGVTRLSGGQQQRVALARAIVYRPKILLFDEPLSNLDAKLRERMRLELRRLQTELSITSVYVTHDQEEAMVMSDRIIVMNHGRIQQTGHPTAIYDRPANRFVADFIGSANLLDGIVRDLQGDLAIVDLPRAGATLRCKSYRPVIIGAQVTVAIRPENIELEAASDGGTRNTVRGTVVNKINMGSFIDCRVRLGEDEIRVHASRAFDAPEGSLVDLKVDPANCLSLPD